MFATTPFTARIVDAVFEGDRILYELLAPDLGDAQLRAVDIDPGGRARRLPGAEVRVSWSAADLLLFDATRENGRTP